MNVSQILKAVKSEVSTFLDEKRKEKNAPAKKGSSNTMDKFVKSNAYNVMDVKTRARYVNGVCYGNGS